MGARTFTRSMMAAATVAVAVVSAVPAAGQTSAYTPPRTEHGQPDLQGIWQVLNTAAWDIEDHNASLGVPAGRAVVEGDGIPYQPWALEKQQENYANRATLDPDRSFPAHGGRVQAFAIAPDGLRAVAGDRGGTVWGVRDTVRRQAPALEGPRANTWVSALLAVPPASSLQSPADPTGRCRG